MFTPKGEVKSLPVGSTPLDFAYAVHTDVGHRCVGAKVNGRIVPLHYTLQSGEFVEVLTSKQERGPSRDWLTLVKSSRARNKIRQWFTQQAREDLEQRGRESLQQALKSNGLPHQKVSSSPLLAGIIREMGFKKADDFYVAIGGGKIQVGQVVSKLIGRLKTVEVVSPEQQFTPARRPQKRPVASSAYGIVVDEAGDPDVLVRMAKCCTPVPGDEICGYISLGRGITIHRDDCPNVRALRRTPERFTPVHWDDSDVGHELVPGHDRAAVVGSPAAARGRRPHVRRARREHRRVRRPRRRPDGAQLVHGRGGRREGAAQPALGASQRRRRVRRLPGHARRLSTGRLPPVSGYEGETTLWQGHPSWKAMLLFYVKWTLISLIPIAVWVVLDVGRPERHADVVLGGDDRPARADLRARLGPAADDALPGHRPAHPDPRRASPAAASAPPTSTASRTST